MSDDKKVIGLNVHDLLVTQAGLRHHEQLSPMIKFVNDGGVFNESALGSYAIREGLEKVAPLIEIAQFEDGKYALHNGHHRVTAIFLGRHHPYLFKNEYFIRRWKYQDYIDIVLPNWVTPFDVRTELRVPELLPWKNEVRKIYIEKGPLHTLEWIRVNISTIIQARGDVTDIEKFVAAYGLYEHLP